MVQSNWVAVFPKQFWISLTMEPLPMTPNSLNALTHTPAVSGLKLSSAHRFLVSYIHLPPGKPSDVHTSTESGSSISFKHIELKEPPLHTSTRPSPGELPPLKRNVPCSQDLIFVSHSISSSDNKQSSIPSQTYGSGKERAS